MTAMTRLFVIIPRDPTDAGVKKVTTETGEIAQVRLIAGPSKLGSKAFLNYTIGYDRKQALTRTRLFFLNFLQIF